MCVLPFALLRSSGAHLSSTNGSQNIAVQREEKAAETEGRGKIRNIPGKKSAEETAPQREK